MLKEFLDFLDFEKRYGLKVLFKDLININKVHLQNYYLNKILKFGKNNNQKYTFFIRTRNIEKRKKLLNKILSLGHEIGSHGYNHINLKKLDRKKLKKEIFNSVNELKKVKIKPNGFRAPFLENNNRVKKVLKQAGYIYCSDTTDTINTIDTIDFRKTNNEKIKNFPVLRPYDWEALIAKNIPLEKAVELWKNKIIDLKKNQKKVFLFHPWIVGKNIKIFKKLFKPNKDYRIISKNNIKISFDVY